MVTNDLLRIFLIIYIILMILGYVFKFRILFAVASLMPLATIFEVDNTLIQTACVALVIFNIFIAFFNEKKGDFE